MSGRHGRNDSACPVPQKVLPMWSVVRGPWSVVRGPWSATISACCGKRFPTSFGSRRGHLQAIASDACRTVATRLPRWRSTVRAHRCASNESSLRHWQPGCQEGCRHLRCRVTPSLPGGPADANADMTPLARWDCQVASSVPGQPPIDPAHGNADADIAPRSSGARIRFWQPGCQLCTK